MRRDVYELAKAQKVVQGLDELVKLIQLPNTPQRVAALPEAKPAPVDAAPVEVDAFGSLDDVFEDPLEPEPAITPELAEFWGDVSDDEVQITAMRCSCPNCSIEVPGALRGEQRHETAKEPKPSKRGRVSNKALKPKSMKHGIKRPAASKPKASKGPVGIVLPVQLVVRKTRRAEAYLVHNVPSHRFVAGQSLAKSSRYIENCKSLAARIESGKIKFIDDAKSWIAKQG